MFKKVFTIFVLTLFVGVNVSSLSFAKGAYDLKELTPEVKVALDSRRANFSAIRGLKSQKVIGENNQGYVEVLVEGKDVEDLVEQENKDRKTIYMTIAQQHGIEDSIEVIEKVFAQVQRDDAKPGDQIQDLEGNWTEK